MKKLKRKFLEGGGDRISFGSRKGFSAERHFEKSRYSNVSGDLFIDYGIEPSPERLNVFYIYIDANKKETTYQEEVNLPPDKSIKERVVKKSVAILKDGSSLLKIRFEVLTFQDSNLFITFQ